jgi:hypothetical protein
MSKGISAHGTLISRAGTVIGELKDITPPPITRNALELTTHNDDYDSYIVGIKRRGEMTFTVNFIPSGETQALNGLVKAWDVGSLDAYVVTYPDLTRWVFSGYVTNVAPTAPVDGPLEASITVRPTGSMLITNP